jgi:hypothetical protein
VVEPPANPVPEPASADRAGPDAAHPHYGMRRFFARLPRVLYLQLADCYQGVSERVGGPDLGDVGSWVRQVSYGARRKLTDARASWTGRSGKDQGRAA